METPTFVVLAHCTFPVGRLPDCTMHEHPVGMPLLGHTFVASIIDGRDGRRALRGCMIFKGDVDGGHPLMPEFTRTVLESAPVLGDMLEDDEQSVTLVSVRLRDPLTVVDGDGCRTLFMRQVTEHATAGRA